MHTAGKKCGGDAKRPKTEKTPYMDVFQARTQDEFAVFGERFTICNNLRAGKNGLSLEKPYIRKTIVKSCGK